MGFEANIGEDVLWEEHPSWRGMFWFYIKWIALLIVTLVIMGFMDKHNVLVKTEHIVYVFIIGVATIVLVGWLMRVFTKYVITDKRVVHISGILTRRTDQCSLSRIQNTIVSISIPERILGIGKISIDTAADDRGRDIIFWGVSNPHAISAMITDPHHQLDRDDPRLEI